MKRDSFYKLIIVALLLLNFGILAYLWIGNKNNLHPRHEEPAGFIIERLQLDAQQRIRFDRLKHEHQQASRKLREDSKDLHDALFSSLKNDKLDSATIDSLMFGIAQNDSAKEQLNYTHFKELKTLLKPEQYHLYNEFIEDIAKRFGHRQAPPPNAARRTEN